MLKRFIVIKAPKKAHSKECRAIIMSVYEETKDRAFVRARRDKAMLPDKRYLKLRGVVEKCLAPYEI